MAVSACLDDGHDFAAGNVTGDLEVVSEVLGVNLDPCAGRGNGNFGIYGIAHWIEAMLRG